MSTGFVYDPIFLEHDLPGHPENSNRLRMTLKLLQERGLLERLTPIPATPVSMERLTRVHHPEYVRYVEEMAYRGGGHLDPDTYVARKSYEAALMAAGGLTNAVEAVLEGRVNNAFALIRPPGHHAFKERGAGFCLFNNVAVAARYALAERQLKRILIVDFDVHHGNGTQDEFYEEAEVLYFSTHQYPHYPGTGHWRETGKGAGQGYTINVPLAGGVGDAGFVRIFDEILYPIAERYLPQLVLVSAGYDAHWDDPLASLQLSIKGYTELARKLKAIADLLCDGRVVFTLEGGYHLQVLAHCVLNTCEMLLGSENVVDPLGPSPWPERDISDLLAQIKSLHGLG